MFSDDTKKNDAILKEYLLTFFHKIGINFVILDNIEGFNVGIGVVIGIGAGVEFGIYFIGPFCIAVNILLFIIPE